ncbi:MAG: DUF1641 domain-containing protein [Edaphobacter sp.]|uniref:DUF1641 domain-containing protein n=1 Tax=Edaphobacter sp. TaxID=1934404 RepID=UPI002383870F|nr:DUF1641 domain-containing protein [Edaphobacter sp.]MDE1176620.1 DUF1641 domain-containing protein [Edaphobacter sp.]
MAAPLNFKPAPADPHVELQRRLDAAPREHAEALLVLYDIVQAAHDKGILDTVHGAITARDTIFGKLAELARTPQGETGIRNMLTSARLLASIDPELLEQLTNTLTPVLNDATEQQKHETTPPSLWQIFKRTTSEDGRRGLSFATLLLTGLGRSLQQKK